VAIAYFNGGNIAIPNLTAVKGPPIVNADASRTAGNYLRVDSTGEWMGQWDLDIKYATRDEYEAIFDHLSLRYGVTTFWIDTMGGTPANSVDVYATITNADRVMFSRDGTFHSDGVAFSLHIEQMG